MTKKILERLTPATEQQAAERTISKIMIKWERDHGVGVDCLDHYMILDNKNRVDVQKTYKNIQKERGVTPEEARQETSENIARVNAWEGDECWYAECTAFAIYHAADQDTGKAKRSGVAEYHDRGILISFSGAEEQKAFESRAIGELYDWVKKAGYSISREAWDALPRQQAEDSFHQPTDTDPAENVKPLPALPKSDAHFTYRYGSQSDGDGDYNGIDDAEGEVLATCKKCKARMRIEDKNAPEWHGSECKTILTMIDAKGEQS